MASRAPDPVYVLRGTRQPISSLDFILPNSSNDKLKYLASGTQEGLVSIWDLKIRGAHLQWAAHNSSVLWINFIDFSNLWTCGRRDSVVLWDIAEGSAKKKESFSLGDYLGFSRCDIMKEEMLLSIPGPTQESVSLWDVKSAKRISKLIPADAKAWGCVMQCKWLQYDHHLYLLVAYENGVLCLWDWSNNKILSTLNYNDNPLSLEFDPCSLRGLCGTTSEKVFVFTLNKVAQTLHCETTFTITNPGLGCICSRPDIKLYATGGWDYRVRLFSWKKHKPLAVLLYHKKSIECVAFSKGPVETMTNGYLLAAGSSDEQISLWDIYN